MTPAPRPPWRLKLAPQGSGGALRRLARACGLAALGRLLLAPLPTGWREAVIALGDARVARMGFLGFSAGLPLLLVFSTLSVWLREAGIDRATVTMLSWAALAYSFKFVWAPLVDRLPLPVLGRLGRRRSWLAFAQGLVCLGLVWTAAFDPAVALPMTALGAVIIAFAAATQDVVIDAYRIEAAEPALQSLMSASYIAGYRVGMLVSGAGSLWLAALLDPGTGYDPAVWATVYRTMAAVMALGLITTLVIPEPERAPQAIEADDRSTADQLRFVGVIVLAAAAFLGGFVALDAPARGIAQGLHAAGTGEPLALALAGALRLIGALAGAGVAASALIALGLASREHLRRTYIAPIADFFGRYGRLALLVLALIGSYRMADVAMGAIANVFYVDMGFTKEQIATYTKFWGLWATLLGGFLGGIVALRVGVMGALFIGAVLAALSNLLFAALAGHPGETLWLMIAIVGDNLSAGMASAAFVAYLSALTSVRFTAMQYALFSSLMTLLPKVLAGYGGSVVDTVGYASFFIGTAALGLPVLVLVALAARFAPPKSH
ncbi:MFS transporter [Rhodospirillum rubrum]|uniref:AmpG family muropeptide MFS transporter n=1 Tax=Rhodospirillum rubrum TaxID=1085 RepID=UPI001904BE5F|nr:MFS transporter [Rhodospirillum rubrum]MBK1666266.1 MFS transporter [Rhodospirillum rubrum]MBK1678391.1 MFS transporter [Rhodospirillum rubrum]